MFIGIAMLILMCIIFCGSRKETEPVDIDIFGD